MLMFKRGGRIAPSSRRALFILPVWVASFFWMWLWWLTPERVNYLPLFIPLSMAIFYEFAILPTAFLYFVLKAKKPPKKIAQKGHKVAVITLCVPSKESMDIVERQLKAMSEITYPHDSWVLDEGNSPEVKLLAKKYGVKHFSRKGIRKYNRPIPPFKAKTKAGNVNAWLDRVKWRKYDFFVQLDIDHIPKPNYLNKTLGYFKDEQIAWVQAPSVYSNRQHWTARGAAEQELVLQGPLQMGFYGFSHTPFIIGSHCTYRMNAVREIGGFAPTRAEDHLDTVMLSSLGYKGVFLPEIIAEGDGPETLNTYLAQQFAWAYSMFQVLLKHSYRLLKSMDWRRRVQFLFAQTWYPLWSIAYFTMFITPLVALLLGHDVARMDGNDFLVHFIPVFICSFLVWWTAIPIMQPRKLMLSWRGMILHVVRWPVVLKAVFSAAFNVKKPYMITPKGSFSQMAPTLSIYKPFLTLGLASAWAVIVAGLIYGQQALLGQAVFALTNAVLMLGVCLVDIDIRLRQSHTKLFKLSADWLKPIVATSALALIATFALIGSPIFTQQLAFAVRGENKIKVQTKEPVPISKMSTEQLIEEIKAVAPKQTKLPTMGIYNEKGLAHSNKSYIQHTFSDWHNDRYIAQQLLISLKQGNTPLITIEPRRDVNGKQLLNLIANGSYDKRISQLAKILGATKQTIYIRFAHEMELHDLYAWGNQDPVEFIKAYRHVINLSRQQGAKNVKWVWSPAGNQGAEAYYPGNKYVDVIGTTILYDKYWYGSYQPSFAELSQKRTWLLSYNKPVWVVEFGVGTSNVAYQQQLINDSLKSYKQLGFSALLYLNMKDANLNGPNYSLHSLEQFGDLFKVSPKPASIKFQPKKECLNKALDKQSLFYFPEPTTITTLFACK